MNNSNYPQTFPKLGRAWCVLSLMGVLIFSASAFAGSTHVSEKNLSTAPAVSSETRLDSTAASEAAADNLAGEAKQEFKGGFKGVGRGFSQGTKATGRAFKTAGVTVGNTFKKVGSTIKNWFTGEQTSSVEERDLGESATQYVPAGDLDAVGDEAKPMMKKSESASSKSDLAIN